MDIPQWLEEEVLKKIKENKAPQDAFEMIKNIEIMNTKQLQNDKLLIIKWITELQDSSVIEKIKSLITASNSSYVLTDEQQKTLDRQVNEDKSSYNSAEKLYTDLKTKKMLDARLADHIKNPDDAIDFDDLLDELENQI